MVVRCFFYLFLFFGLFLSPVAIAEGAVVSGAAPGEMKDVLVDCLSLADERDACYATACEYEPGYLCAEDVLDVVVEIAGPERAMGVLHEIMASPVFAITSDGHLLSHIVGRATSRVFGSSGNNFLRCPSDFNNGCFHGFFEDTLPKSDSPVDVVVSICENMPPDTPLKEKSYCYHGAGHVFMMQVSHDLDAAIDLCLQVPENWSESCWQGVFMENAGEREWELKRKNFREDEPLYPCTAVEDRFKTECYVNHHGYLIRHYSESWDELVAVCLGAEDFTHACLGGLGLMLGSDFWTTIVAQGTPVEGRPHTEQVVFLCNQFPYDYIDVCYSNLIPSFLNFDGTDIRNASGVCALADAEHRHACFERIGSYLSNLVSDESEKIAVCHSVPREYRDACLGVRSEEFDGYVDREVSEGTAANGSGSFFSRAVQFLSALFGRLATAFTRPVHAHSGGSDEQDLSRYAHPELHQGLEVCLSLQEGRDMCYLSLCDGAVGFLCAEDVLHTATVGFGPEVAMQVLEEMIASPLFSFNAANEGHSLAHAIGRITAQHFGGTGDAFLRCPTALDYGCQHGFLEDALIRVDSPAEAVTNICESLPAVPTIGRPNCYHGSGHGVMMNASYDLAEALAVCDQVPDPLSCFTGVAMENVSGKTSGRIQELYAEHDSFEKDNPLAPCDTLTDTLHRRACYRQHMPYLASYFSHDLQDVVDACLGAGDPVDIRDCVFGFGAYGIYDGIQESFLHGFEGDFMDKIIIMCNQFPEEYRMHCYTPAIDQSTVFYRVKRASDFCYKIDARYMRECFNVIGDRLRSLVVDRDETEAECSSVPEEYRIECTDPHRHQGEDVSVDTPFGVIAVEQASDSLFAWVKQLLSDIVADVFSVLGMFARPVSAQSVAVPLAEGVEKCLEQGGEVACYASLCAYESGYLCAESILEVVTKGWGPEVAMEILMNMIQSPLFSFSPSSEGHNLAHTVGRVTAQWFGSDGVSFIRCPTDLAYGCHHGFFEVALVASEGDPAAAVHSICEHMPDKPELGKVSCYHGAGHGIMMHESHDLDRALAVCDQLSHGRNICYDGVFMEHINARHGLGSENNQFDVHNPLAPCNVVAEKYRHDCFYRHGNYLFPYFGYLLEDVIEACLGAGEHIEVCLTAVSGSLFLPSFQERVFPGMRGSLADKATTICGVFPDGYKRVCYVVFAGEATIFHGAKEASTLCSDVDKVYQSLCLREVNRRVNDLAATDYERIAMCAAVSEEYQHVCLSEGDFDRRSDQAEETASSTPPSFLHDLFAYVDSVVRSFFSAVVAIKRPIKNVSHADCDASPVWRYVGDFVYGGVGDRDYFGDAVSLFGTTLAVGAFGDDAGDIDTGAVYLFELGGGALGDPLLKISGEQAGEGLLNVGLEARDRLGRGLSLQGNTLAVGAYYDSEKKGAVYLFESDAEGVWSQSLKISDNEGGKGLLPISLSRAAHFGASVSLHGNRLAVGAYLSDDGMGAVYLFERDADGIWSYLLKLSGTVVPHERDAAFGRSVSLYGDFLAVGAPRSGPGDTGAVYLFNRDASGTWDLVLEFSVTGAGVDLSEGLDENDHFGTSVFLRDTVLAVGAYGDDSEIADTGAVYLFEKSVGSNWEQSLKISNASELFIVPLEEGGMFGSAVSFSDEVLVVGGYLYDSGGTERGVVYLFENELQNTCSAQYRL